MRHSGSGTSKCLRRFGKDIWSSLGSIHIPDGVNTKSPLFMGQISLRLFINRNTVILLSGRNSAIRPKKGQPTSLCLLFLSTLSSEFGTFLLKGIFVNNSIMCHIIVFFGTCQVRLDNLLQYWLLYRVPVLFIMHISVRLLFGFHARWGGLWTILVGYQLT